jgi:hypothetical protein
VRIDPKRTYLFQDAIRCAAAQFGVETNHPKFVGLVTSTRLDVLDVADRGQSSADVRRCTQTSHKVGLI